MPSDAIVAALEELATALEAGDRTGVDDALRTVESAFADARPAEDAALARANTARRQGLVPSDARETVSAFVRSASGIEVYRSTIVAAGLGYVNDPSTQDASTLAEQVRELADAEREFVSERDAADPVLADLTVPPLLSLAVTSSPDEVQKGNTATVELRVQNAGDGTTEPVSVAVETEAAVSPTTTDLGTLEPNTATEVGFTVDGDTAGSFTLTFTATAGELREEASVDLRVLNKADQIEVAADTLAAVRESVAELDDRTNQSLTSVEKLLKQAADRLSDAESLVEDDRPEQADRRLSNATVLLGDALNVLDNLFDLDGIDTGGESNGNGGGTGNGSGNGSGGNNGNDDSSEDPPTGARAVATAIERVIDEVALARETAA